MAIDCLPPIRFEHFLKAAWEGVLLIDRASRQIVRANSVICRMLGHTEAELQAMRVTRILSRKDRDNLCQLLDADCLFDTCTKKNVVCRRRNGRRLRADVTFCHAGHEQNAYAILLFRDVTDRRHVRTMLQLQRELAETLNANCELPVSLERILDVIMRLPGIDCGGIYLLDRTTGDLQIVGHRNVSPQFAASAARIPAASPEAELAQAAAPGYFRAEEIRTPLRTAVLGEGLRAVALVPIRQSQEVVGILCLCSRTYAEIPRRTRDALEVLSVTIGGLLAQFQATASLIPPHDRTRLILDYALDGFAIIDMDERLRDVNAAYCQMLGYSREELLQMRVGDLDIVEPPPRRREHLRTLRRQGAVRFHTQHQHRDGRAVDIGVSLHCCHYRNEELIFAFFRDMGRHNRMERALQESEQRYRLIADNVKDVIWTVQFAVTDAEKAALANQPEILAETILDRWTFDFVSPSVQRLFGYTPEEVANVSLRDFVKPASLERIRNGLIAQFTPTATEPAKDQSIVELELVGKDGALRWCEVVGSYMRDAQGLPSGVLGITRDISKRRIAEQAYRESEAKFRTLFENLPDFVIVVDRNAQILFVNHAVPGVDMDALARNNGFHFLIPEHRSACRAAFETALNTGRTQTVEACDIFDLWWSCRVVPLAAEGKIDYVMVICTNVTEQRAAGEAVHKEQALLRRLLDLHEQDRRLMAYEIHDGFVQFLAGALFRLQAFRDTLARDPDAAWEAHDTATRLVSRAIADARRVISGLRPPILDEAGIVEAVDYLVYENQRNGGPAIEFVHDIAVPRLAPPLETAIFRIVQETLRNACRHSGSKRVSIELTQRGQTVYLEVRDWGIGFDPSRVAEQRFGLQGVRERVRLLGGRIAIESTPGEGTRICVELPLVVPTNGQSKEKKPS